MKPQFLIGIIFVVLCSCNNKKKHYYTTGELWYITYDISDSIYHVNEYFKNGVLKAEGDNNINADHVGHWKEYYSDGALKWESNFERGKIVISEDGKWPDFTKINGSLEIAGSPSVLRVGYTYKIRIRMPQVHPFAYIVTDIKYNPLKKNSMNPDEYPYLITPNQKGKFFVLLTYIQPNGKIVTGKSTMLFPLDVE